tara:strand:- start:722 stop:1282 length:561 start_codon:yes stop_codon:yes gene_type:complete
MRIISGNFKGKKIAIPKDKKTRPLRDLVKESIFNLIEHSNKFNSTIEKSKILDLFSGTGSFGLECISRNAGKVTFVENYQEARDILKKNILDLNVEKKCEVIKESCFDFIDSKKNLDEKFNLIFMDPPYKEEKINLIIDAIKEKRVLNDEGILIIHRHKNDNIKISSKLTILDERSYGISKIIIAS